MLILITLIFLGLFLICIFNRCDEDVCTVFVWGFILSFIITILCTIPLSGRMTINDKIEMYTDENNKIQTEISAMVENYKSYEASTFENIKTESPITLVSLFPELKSDTLISKQIDIYVSNNQSIKNLKISKIDKKRWAWWVYFGK